MNMAILSAAGAGLLAGAMNAVAGGGSFVTLPALVAAGVPPVLANATSTVALFPGSLAAAWTMRAGLRPFEGVGWAAMAATSVGGGLAGALLLLITPDVTFGALLPWLLLFGTLAFTFGRQAGARLRRVITLGPAALLAAQFVLGMYGGYFGGAVGITMMAVWSLFGTGDLRAMNAARVLLVVAANATAVLCFIIAGRVAWAPALVLGATAILGSYGGARLARSADPVTLRRMIIGLCSAMTVAFFARAYLF
ncbi:sulfite exporter TauE/SafE family protein [Acidisphaera sp. L21]|uniref:sulfite exporter TauE/SafE family protein n=1 Tax=Acidisphaera sp. L21 TaxID=1641851 RepID=UPI00131E49B6|nr:sulfite exporter TauE/SafE family protein [Acidisphaera sp. L21]